MAPSVLWKYFTKLDKTSAKCNFCGKKIQTSGNTSNLSSHLKTHGEYGDVISKGSKPVSEKEVQNKLNVYGFSLGNPSSNAIAKPVQDKNTESSRDITPMENNEAEPGCSTWSDCTYTNSQCISLSSTKENVKSTIAVKKKKGTSSTLDSYDCCEDSLSASSGSIGTIQPTILGAFQNVNSYKKGGQSHAKITDAIVYYLCKDNQAYATVEGDGFRHLLSTIVPLYVPPSRELIKRSIETKYELLSQRFIKMLGDVEYLSLTTDIWTGHMSMTSYLGITVHFINVAKMKSCTLGVVELHESHTNEYISEELLKVLLNWGDIYKKVCCVITDNGANIVKAVHVTFGPEKHLPCAAHTLNLVSENGIKNTVGLSELLSKIRNIVKWVKKSTVNTDALKKKQIDRGKADGTILKVILDVPTRWNSVFYMAQRFVELSTYINELLLENPSAPDTVSAMDLNILKEVIQILKPLEKLTTELSSKNNVSVSKVIPMVNCVKEGLKNINPQLEICISLKESIEKEIHKRFGKIEQNHILAVATILDPRFKTIHFSDPVSCSKTLSIIRKEISSIVNQSAFAEESLETRTIVSTDSTTGVFDLWGYHRDLVHKKAKMSSGLVQDELSLYLSLPIIANLNQNPLQYWEDVKMTFPNLYKISQRYLHILATSVPAERLFSKAGATKSKARNRLSGKRLSKLLFLNSLQKEDWGLDGLI